MSSRIRIIAAAVCSVVFLISLHEGCRNEDSAPVPPPPSPCSFADTAVYGTGSSSFSTPGAGDTFAVRGNYRTSIQFSSDSAGSGAGGFVCDTVFGGHRLKAEIVAYVHRQTSSGIDERFLELTLNDTVFPPSSGQYPLAPAGAGRAAAGLYLYYSDSLGIFSVYEFLSGALTITSIDTCARTIAGTFAGILRGLPPDTLTTATLSGGSFAIRYVRHPFIY